MIELAVAVGLQLMDAYNHEQIALPANPTVKTIHNANPKTWRAIAMNPIFHLVTIQGC